MQVQDFSHNDVGTPGTIIKRKMLQEPTFQPDR
jgi:hypothetical protein